MNKFQIPPLVLLMVCAVGIVVAEGPAPDNGSSTDRGLTPLDQSQGKSDIALVAAARREVLAVKDLSVSGQNIKIITGAGRVTLRGPVASAAERLVIETAVRRVSGSTVIDNQLEVE